MADAILTMEDIDKSFPGVHALDHVHFDVRSGEVHALMGENGAGKSTLMKVLTGIYSKDSGTITYEGREVAFTNTREAQDAENGNVPDPTSPAGEDNGPPLRHDTSDSSLSPSPRQTASQPDPDVPP